MKKDYFLGLSEEGFHRVSYMEWGVRNDQQTPIICLHGLTRNGRDFDDLAAFLSQQGLHIFCPDVVGRGDSDWLKNPLHYTYEQYVADMTDLIARINAKEIDWIGTSMGGLIGMFLASLPKNPIRRLILNDIGPQIPTKAIARMAQYAGKEPEFANVDEATKYYKTIYSGFGNLTEQQWQRLTEVSIKQNASGKFISKLDQGIKLLPAKSKIAWKALLHPLKALEGSLFDIDLWDIWRKISCPVLIIRGKNSDFLLPEILSKMQKIHPDTDVIEIKDTGHAPMLFDENEHRMIYDWLNKNV